MLGARTITLYPDLGRKYLQTGHPLLRLATGFAANNLAIAQDGQLYNLMDRDRNARSTITLAALSINGGFDDATGWTAGGNWNIGGGKASTDSGAGTSDLTRATAMIVGVTYSVTFTILTQVSGDVKVKLGTAAGTVRTAPATYTEIITCAGNTTLTLSADDASELAIDNVSITPMSGYYLEYGFDKRRDFDSLVIDGHNLRNVYPDQLGQMIEPKTHTSSSHASASDVAADSYVSRLLGKATPFLDLDGVDDKVSVADSPQLDFGKGDGTLGGWFYMPDVSGDVRFITRHVDGNNDVWFMYQKGGGILQAAAYIGGIYFQRAEVSWTPTANRWYHLVWTFVNGTSNALYIDGVSQTLSTNTTTGGDIALTQAMEFGFDDHTTTYFRLHMRGARMYNRSLSSAEVTTWYDGGVIATADQWSSQTALQTSNFVNAGYATFDGASATGFHAIWGAGTDRAGTVDEMALVAGVTYNVTFNLNAALWQNPTIFLVDALNGNDIGGGPQTATPGFNKNLTFLCTQTTTGAFQFQNTAAAEYTLANFKIVPLGCVAEWGPDGINQADGKLYDASSNNLDGTITGADAYHTPESATEYEATLVEFTQVNALFAYLDFNPNDALPAADLLMGRVYWSNKIALNMILPQEALEVGEGGGPGSMQVSSFERGGEAMAPLFRGLSDAVKDQVIEAWDIHQAKFPLYAKLVDPDDASEITIRAVWFDGPPQVRRTGSVWEVVIPLRGVPL
ncbi:MAG: LamG domain-containing protein [Candidatus Marinimicrobia bacterium]|nr:LamG domain-containing protein [Candidatus Neomarinimicrobiota bacterium]